MDADGPLARLKKAIFNPELYENIAEWIVVSVFFGLLALAKQEMLRVSQSEKTRSSRPHVLFVVLV